MPAQKRFLSNYQDDDNNDEDDENSPEQQQQQQQQHRRRKQSRRAMEEEQQQVEEEEEDEQEQTQDDDGDGDGDGDDQEGKKQSSDDDSDGSGTDPEAFDELIAVSRSEIRTNDFDERSFLAQLFQARKDLECPICLGIIKRTRVVMGCQHRFCRECIDKSMRLGNNECPACRIHCASRRSLRDDPGFDTLIEAIYPDVEKYEEEELVFLEEERAINDQIQASIAKISQRQSEALIKRRKGKDIASPSSQRTSRNYHAYSRRKRNSQSTEPERSDPNESENDDHDEIKDSPLKDERGTQTKFRKHRRRKGALTTQTSPSAASLDGGHIETAVQLPRVTPSNSPGPAVKPETLAWGRGGVRSHIRHGSGGSRNARNTRVTKLVDYLDSVRAKDDELNVHLVIIPLDKQATPGLKKPHLCCMPSTSVGHLCEFVAQETKSQAIDVELLAVKINTVAGYSIINHSILMDASNMLPQAVDGSNVTLERLERQDTVGGISSSCWLNKNLILVYVHKNSAV